MKDERNNMIIHIIHRSIFLNGYRKYMDSQFPEYEHLFFTKHGETIIDDHSRTYEIKELGDLFENTTYRKYILSASKIIVSGIFYSPKDYIGLMKNLSFFRVFIKKSFFQFWGADFYKYREKTTKPIFVLDKMLSRYFFKRAAGLIFLVPGEYKVFQTIMHISNRFFTAPMSGDPEKAINYDKYRKNEKTDNIIRILIGNSSSSTNHHIDAFELIKHLKQNKIEIYCPLSYGNEEYKKQVIDAGKAIFGESFFPITEFMDKDKYIEFLSKMDIGIFNNDRQQALGNISILLNLGKKIYLRPDTSMWDYFDEQGYKLFSINKLKEIDIDELCYFSVCDYEQNINIYSAERNLKEKNDAWKSILTSEVFI